MIGAFRGNLRNVVGLVVLRKLRQVFGAALVVFVASGATAGVSVYPTELFVSSPNRSAPLTISNPSDSLLEVWVAFGYSYPVAFDSGKVTMSRRDSVGTGELSASSWLYAYPQRFTLRPQTSQVVRVFGVPPAGLASGEYWSRVIISSKPKNPRVVETKSRQTKISMELVSQTSVPFHYRTGTVSTKLVVQSARALIDDGHLNLRLDLRRSGNASFWGRIGYKLFNSAGRVIHTKDFRIVVYKEMAYSVQDSLPAAYEGPYTVELLFDNQHMSVAPQYRIPSESSSMRIPVIGP